MAGVGRAMLSGVPKNEGSSVYKIKVFLKPRARKCPPKWFGLHFQGLPIFVLVLKIHRFFWGRKAEDGNYIG